jgi:hypothetical protein
MQSPMQNGRQRFNTEIVKTDHHILGHRATMGKTCRDDITRHFNVKMPNQVPEDRGHKLADPHGRRVNWMGFITPLANHAPNMTYFSPGREFRAEQD